MVEVQEEEVEVEVEVEVEEVVVWEEDPVMVVWLVQVVVWEVELVAVLEGEEELEVVAVEV